MDEKMLLQSIGQMMDDKLKPIQSEMQGMKADINSMKTDINSMNADINGMKTDINGIKVYMQDLSYKVERIDNRALNIELTLENETNKHIQLLMEGHKQLADDIKDIKKDTSQIEDIKTRLFATETVTKENVQNIKKLQTGRKI